MGAFVTFRRQRYVDISRVGENMCIGKFVFTYPTGSNIRPVWTVSSELLSENLAFYYLSFLRSSSGYSFLDRNTPTGR